MEICARPETRLSYRAKDRLEDVFGEAARLRLCADDRERRDEEQSQLGPTSAAPTRRKVSPRRGGGANATAERDRLADDAVAGAVASRKNSTEANLEKSR